MEYKSHSTDASEHRLAAPAAVSANGGELAPGVRAPFAGRPLFREAEGEALDNTLGVIRPLISPELQSRQMRRRIRHSRMSYLWDVSSLRSVRSCGRAVVGSNVDLRLTKSSDGSSKASIAGLQSCGSHVCAVCSASLSMARKSDLQTAIQRWEAAPHNGRLLLLTLTMRHKPSHISKNALKHMWDALSYAFGTVASGKQWKAEKAKYGIAGYVRCVELMVKPVPPKSPSPTRAASGWDVVDEHIHTHSLIWVREDLTDEQLSEFKSSIVGRWQRALERKGLYALPQGQDLKRVSGNAASFGEYFTKQSGEAIALELTQGASKNGKSGVGSMPPFAVLDIARKQNDPAALRWWNHYEKTQRSRRRMVWSRGLRELLEIGVEKSDEEILEEAEASSSVTDTVAVLTTAQWRKLVAQPHRIVVLLETLEIYGVSRALKKLTQWGIGWSPPPSFPRPEASPG